jgi:hypothetical protein
MTKRKRISPSKKKELLNRKKAARKEQEEGEISESGNKLRKW